MDEVEKLDLILSEEVVAKHEIKQSLVTNNSLNSEHHWSSFSTS